MDEEAIIKERVVKPEVVFKRLQRLCENVTNGIPQTAALSSLRAQLETEFESFATRVSKMELEVQMSEREIERYQKQREQSILDIEKLNIKSQELQDRLAKAQFIRSQKEECNAMIDDMMKAKRVMVPDPSGGDKMIPIIGLLNSSRAEDIKLNASLTEEIASLEHQRDILQAQWDNKKQQVVGLMEFVDRFKEDIIKKEEVYTAESGRRRNDEADDGDEVEMDGDDDESGGERLDGNNEEEPDQAKPNRGSEEAQDIDQSEKEEYSTEGIETAEVSSNGSGDDIEMADTENM